MLHQFFTFVQLHDTQLTTSSLPFPHTLNTMTFDHSTYGGFATCACTPIAEGLLPSHEKHCFCLLKFLLASSSIQDTLRDLLKGYHYDYSNTTIHKYMKELGLRSVTRRKKPEYRKGNTHKFFPNLLKQNFKTDKRNQIWCTDLMYGFYVLISKQWRNTL